MKITMSNNKMKWDGLSFMEKLFTNMESMDLVLSMMYIPQKGHWNIKLTNMNTKRLIHHGEVNTKIYPPKRKSKFNFF